MSLQEEIIQQLGVKSSIDPQEEIRRSVDFLKRYLKKHPFLKTFVLGISGGQDSTLAGRLAQLAMEGAQKQEMPPINLLPFVFLMGYRQMKQMHKKLWPLSSRMLAWL